jgi:hypothetical protein
VTNNGAPFFHHSRSYKLSLGHPEEQRHCEHLATDPSVHLQPLYPDTRKIWISNNNQLREKL